MLRKLLKRLLFLIAILGIFGFVGYGTWVLQFAYVHSPDKLADVLSNYQAGGGFVGISDITARVMTVLTLMRT